MSGTEFLEPFERMVGQLFPPARVREIDGGSAWDRERQEIEESGFIDSMVAEHDGGAGLSLSDTVALWRVLGRHAAPLAIGEAMIDRASPSAVQHEAARLLLTSAAISGAADHVLVATVDYAGTRVQFGKPIGRQQALQQQLALMAEDCLAVRLSVELAAMGEARWPATLRTAAAKTVASSAAPRIASVAHAIHGAIGISEEYDLQLHTGRLHQWRLALGSEGRWSRQLGSAVLASNLTALDWTRAELFGEV
ncbi:hypothetical protein GCM10011515_03910 [Tsuneonella deserti]|uniref:Acyl-CoA dehydrogenase/oxidase C-terminal domain-containing protein n=1 Tax=Tsuneonella deserti TaxID=2035528 RepID=A0ABQ1S2T1_9SPHN|nr:acyl-CoA dehydrogenase family protein [Tsuneonella deserti]GGD87551.1 hypothetical protein GCM10011515_03910 [Tsuneonella deserti]